MESLGFQKSPMHLVNLKTITDKKQLEWQSFTWLRREQMDGKKCIICEKTGKNNSFTKGSINYKTSRLVEHS